MYDEIRLERLIAAYFDGQLSADEKLELEAMLLGSARARRQFFEQSDWHGLTREWALQSQAELLMVDTPSSLQTLSARNLWIGVGLAACVLLTWILIPDRVPQATPPISREALDPTRDDVALLVQAIDVEWESAPQAAGTALAKGLVKIRKGTLRLDFYSGARVILEGPASLDLLSQNMARLSHGRLTARVPPPAEGFTILNADLRVVDRGTEFGISATEGDECEVHVFDGEVELQGDVPEATARALFGGEAVSIRNGRSVSFSADRLSFIDPAIVRQAATREIQARYDAWQKTSAAFRESADLLVYFDFQQLEPGGTLLTNRADRARETTHGSIIGCEILAGRWTDKPALAFAKSSDRVRFRAIGSCPSLTMMAWVRVDSLPQDHNSLLSMSPDEIGEIHWKLDRSGRLLLGLRADLEHAFASWERLESPPIVTPQDFGRWMHLATVIDGENRVMKHFLDGQEVASAPLQREVSVQLGLANLGNFDASSPDRQEAGILRSFNGRIDEFALVRRALDAREIAAMK